MGKKATDYQTYVHQSHQRQAPKAMKLKLIDALVRVESSGRSFVKCLVILVYHGADAARSFLDEGGEHPLPVSRDCCGQVR